MAAGYSHFKLFPANVAGGVGRFEGFLRSVPEARFCPTGGVSLQTAGSYLGTAQRALRRRIVGSRRATPLKARDWKKHRNARARSRGAGVSLARLKT